VWWRWTGIYRNSAWIFSTKPRALTVRAVASNSRII